MLRPISRAYEHLLTAINVAAMGILPLAAAAITFEVVMRYAFSAPTRWAIDFAAYCLLWITFLASPRLVRERGHITIAFVVSLLPPRGRLALEAVTSLVAAGVAAILFWTGLTATIDAFIARTLTVGSWEIPRAYVWAVIPVGSFFLVVEFLGLAIRSAREARRPTVADKPLSQDVIEGPLH